MTKYTARITFGDSDNVEYIEHVYDTREEAKEEADQWLADYSAGADALALAGRPFGDPDLADYEIIELD